MMIQGVLGPIDTAELGQTLMHEHITCADWSMRMNFGARFFEFDQVAEIAAGQLGKAKALGVRTVVDGTPVNLGRDIRLIRTGQFPWRICSVRIKSRTVADCESERFTQK